MSTLLNTLFVTTEGSYVRLDHDTVRIEREGETVLRVPLIHLGGLAAFGNVLLSPFLIHALAEGGRSLSWFDRNGRFKARLVGGTSGNVLLRRAQHEAVGSALALKIARNMIAGKIRNSRQLLLRSSRETDDPARESKLKRAATALRRNVSKLEKAASLDEARGIEGDSARIYFDHFSLLLKAEGDLFSFDGRNRRPPRDPTNALLSFLYALLRSDCASGLEGVGLDPQVGLLHALRPGRPALALDLMEELRPALADRLALALINRAQLGEKHFHRHSGGAVGLNDKGRKKVIVAYQKRKQAEVRHDVLDRKLPLGLVPHAQARLLARTLRGDIEHYIPFTPK